MAAMSASPESHFVVALAPMSALADVSHFRGCLSGRRGRGRFGCSDRVHEPRGDPNPVWSAWHHRFGSWDLAGRIDHRRHADDAVHGRGPAARPGARGSEGHCASAQRGRSRLRPLAPHPRRAQPAMEGGQLRRLVSRPSAAPHASRARRHLPFCAGCATGGHRRATAERLEGLRWRDANRSGRSSGSARPGVLARRRGRGAHPRSPERVSRGGLPRRPHRRSPRW